MNFVGRAFILTILVLSVLFMSFAIVTYSAKNNWREKAAQLKTELDGLKSKNASLSSIISEKEASYNALVQEKGETIQNLQTKVASLEAEQKANMESLAQLQRDSAKQIAAVVSSHVEVDKTRGEIASLRAALRSAQETWRTAHTNYVNALDESHDLGMKLTRLESVSEELVKQYADAKAVLDQFGYKPIPELYTGVPPYQVAGKISQVRDTTNMVEITIGKDSGIMRGHQLDVYRKADGRDIYIGVVEVVLAEPDRAACKILPEYRKGTVQVDDIVTSEFSQERQKYQMKRNANVAATSNI